MKTERFSLMVLAAALGGGIFWLVEAQPSGASPRGERERVKAAGREQNAPRSDAPRSTILDTCPMHPSVRADRPGACPICGMALRPVSGNNAGTNAPPAAVGTNRPATTMPGCCSPGGCR